MARIYGPRDVRLREEPRPVADPSRGDVLVRVTAVGLCGSDRHWYEEGSIGESTIVAPFVPGHELAGVIDGGMRDGERVVIDPADPCGRCEPCVQGRARLCVSQRFAGHPPTDGGLRQWMVWPGLRCHRVPASIETSEAALLEVLGIALHAVDLGGARAGMTAGVYGAGPVGLMVVHALQTAGVTDVVATDRIAHRVKAAKAAGAVHVIHVDGRGAEAAASAPVDIAFECAGDDAALDTAVRAVRPGGRVVIVGIPSKDRTAFTASVARRKELALVMCRRMEATDLARAISLVSAGSVSLGALITDRYALDEAPAAFDAVTGRRGLKVVVHPWDHR